MMREHGGDGQHREGGRSRSHSWYTFLKYYFYHYSMSKSYNFWYLSFLINIENLKN